MSHPTSATTGILYVDIATYSDVDAFMTGGPSAITHFVKGVQKGNLAAYVPIQLRNQGTFDFGQKNLSALVNRSGDYVLEAWFRPLIPLVSLGTLDSTLAPPAVPDIFRDAKIRWTRNLAHNLILRCSLMFNELTIEEFDSQWLDFLSQCTIPGSKMVGYRNMIGDTAAYTQYVAPGLPLGRGSYLNLLLPFWFSRDSGVALPIAAIPLNDVRISYDLRDLRDLLVIYPGTLAVGGPSGPGTGRAATLSDVVIFQQTTPPSITEAATFAHYAVVHNEERYRMGDAPRDILITQEQWLQASPFKDVSTSSSFDIRISHAIMWFSWAAKNVTTTGEQSNYTTQPGPDTSQARDPIKNSYLYYEAQVRLVAPSDYSSLVHPFIRFDRVPEETGYHYWSYALHPVGRDSLDPSFSTNFSKLTNVSMLYEMSDAAVNASSSTAPVDSTGLPILWPNSSGILVAYPQKWQHMWYARNWNIVRVANGSLGLPTL